LRTSARGNVLAEIGLFIPGASAMMIMNLIGVGIDLLA